jgi:hypothetical protein
LEMNNTTNPNSQNFQSNQSVNGSARCAM